MQHYLISSFKWYYYYDL